MAKAAKWRDLLGGLTLLVVSTALMLLATEYAFRYVLGHSIVLFPRNHAAAQYGPYVLRSMVPNATFWHQSIDGRWRFRTNNKGFRDDRNYAYDKSPGTFRVLVLGDSHTAGFEVHQHEVFTHVLETSLRHSGVKAEVLNTGISGFGTAEHLAFLEQEGLRYRPDVVILAFFGNDYSDSARSGLYKLERGVLTESSRHYAPAVDIIRVTNAIPGLKWLGENSYAYSYLFNAAWDFVKTRSIRQAGTGLTQTNAPSAHREYAVVVREISAAEEDLVVALLKRIAGFARENKIITVLVDIPGVAVSHDINSSLRPKTRQVGIDEFDHMLESDRYLRDRPEGQLVHVPHGHRHISAFTHRRLGEALAHLLTTKGVVTTTARAAPQ
jgi:lysophospholipase L1-like esterase